MNKRRRPDARR